METGSHCSRTLHSHFALQETPYACQPAEPSYFFSLVLCIHNQMQIYTCMHCYCHITQPGISHSQTPEYLHSSSWVQSLQDCSSETAEQNSHCLRGPSIHLCPQDSLAPLHAFYTSLKQITDVLQLTNIPGKDAKSGKNSALASRSIFILHLQLLVHIYISICIPIFIKT